MHKPKHSGTRSKPLQAGKLRLSPLFSARRSEKLACLRAEEFPNFMRFWGGRGRKFKSCHSDQKSTVIMIRNRIVKAVLVFYSKALVYKAFLVFRDRANRKQFVYPFYITDKQNRVTYIASFLLSKPCFFIPRNNLNCSVLRASDISSFIILPLQIRI